MSYWHGHTLWPDLLVPVDHTGLCFGFHRKRASRFSCCKFWSDLIRGDSPGSGTCLNGKFLVNKSASQVHRGYQIASYVLYEVSQTGIFTGMSTFNLRSVFQRSFQRTIPCHKGPHLSPMGALMI